MWIRVLTVAALLALAPDAAFAEPPQAPSAPPAEPQGASAATARADAAPTMPHPNQLLVFIRSTLLAVNHANLTGNYTVLRDLGTPAFQRSNSAAGLSDIFRDLRQRSIDLGPVAVIDPKLVREPSINEDGRLRLSGFFPSQPEQVNFDLAFELVGDRWRLHGIALNTTPVDQPVAAAPSGGSKPAKR